MSNGREPDVGGFARFCRHWPAVGGLMYLGLLAGVLVAWPWVGNQEANVVTEAQFQGPSWTNWCGTDVHGRDVWARMVEGGRISLLVGLVGAGVSLVLGVAWGAVAGYAGGRVDNGMMRIVDVLYTLPSIIFVIVLITALEAYGKQWTGGGPGSDGAGESSETRLRLILLFIGLGAVSWLTMARIVRGQVVSLKARPFVEASRTLGAGPARIVWHHLLPNLWGVVIVYVALTIPSIILYESFLSYLGLGIQPPMASWGSLIAEGADQLNSIRVYWWLIVCPAGMLVTTLLAMNMVGDGLRDALDSR